MTMLKLFYISQIEICIRLWHISNHHHICLAKIYPIEIPSNWNELPFCLMYPAAADEISKQTKIFFGPPAFWNKEEQDGLPSHLKASAMDDLRTPFS